MKWKAIGAFFTLFLFGAMKFISPDHDKQSESAVATNELIAMFDSDVGRTELLRVRKKDDFRMPTDCWLVIHYLKQGGKPIASQTNLQCRGR